MVNTTKTSPLLPSQPLSSDEFHLPNQEIITNSTKTRCAWKTMGTWASLQVAHPQHLRFATHIAYQELHTCDTRFSGYRENNEVYRVARGDTRNLTHEMRSILAACSWLHTVSGGVFTTDTPTGVLDYAGYIKGWAIQRTAETLRQNDIHNFMLGVGGDWYCDGVNALSLPWKIGLVNPTRPHTAPFSFPLSHHAIATSGCYERGNHLVFPTPHIAAHHTTRGTSNGGRSFANYQQSSEIISFTVHGPEIRWADAFATVGYIMGIKGADWLQQFPDYSCAMLLSDGALLKDAQFPSSGTPPKKSDSFGVCGR